MKTIYLNNSYGDKQFKIVTTEKSKATVDFMVYEVISWKDNEPYEEEPYLRAYMKWDNCNHFWFGDDGYMHICGGEAMRQHLELMEFLYKYAFDEMDIVMEENLPNKFLNIKDSEASK